VRVPEAVPGLLEQGARCACERRAPRAALADARLGRCDKGLRTSSMRASSTAPARMQKPNTNKKLAHRHNTLACCLARAGAEPVLRAGMERSAELHDLAKAALRDMRCDVSLSQPWQGMPGESHTLEMGEDAPDTFGAYMDTDEAREAMRFAGFDTSQM